MDISSLAVGGIVAGAVAMWSQVRNFLKYVSSFLVMQVELHCGLAPAVVMYVKKHYKKAPSGLLVYSSLFLKLNNKRWADVPFKILNTTTVFYRSGHIFVLNVKGSSVTIYAIRGAQDVENLIRKALEFDRAISEQDRAAHKESRFFVQRVMGSEKGMWADSPPPSRKLRSLDGEEVAASSDAIADLCQPNTVLDTSFMYKKDEYQWTEHQNPFESLFYDDDIHRHVKQAHQWMEMREWCQSRGIPWRRGWLVYGPGGTGKSSLSLALAQSLNVPLYTYALATLSDQEFVQEWGNMQTPCVALCEDFDTVFNLRDALTQHKALTFDCVLNQISGVSSMDGVFLIVTTNHIEKIDPAMGIVSQHGSISTRPGRIDQVIHLGLSSPEVRQRIAQHILRDWPETHEGMVLRGNNMTVVQFQELCLTYAYSRMAQKEVEDV